MFETTYANHYPNPVVEFVYRGKSQVNASSPLACLPSTKNLNCAAIACVICCWLFFSLRFNPSTSSRIFPNPDSTGFAMISSEHILQCLTHLGQRVVRG